MLEVLILECSCWGVLSVTLFFEYTKLEEITVEGSLKVRIQLFQQGHFSAKALPKVKDSSNWVHSGGFSFHRKTWR